MILVASLAPRAAPATLRAERASPDWESGPTLRERRAASRIDRRFARAGPGPVVRIAQRREELRAAFHLVYEAYVQSGLAEPNPHQIRVTPFQLLPTTEVFVAVDRDRVVCTLSLVRDGELGLPMEAIYGNEVACRRAEGLHLAEVSCLADISCVVGKGKVWKRSLPTVIRLMAFMAQCAKRREVDQLLIAVHPRHAAFYQRFAAFDPIGEEKTYHTVCDNPAVALALDLNRAPVCHPVLYEKFFGMPFPEETMRCRPMPDELLEEFTFLSEETYEADAPALLAPL